MKKDYDFYRYEITNGTFEGIGGADTIAECRKEIEKFEQNDKEIGGRDSYHVYRLNKTTGERLTKVF